MAQIKIDFFRVTMPTGCGLTFEGLLDALIAEPDLKKRNCAFSDHWVRLQQGSKVGEFYEGDLVRIQMDKLPLKAHLDGPVKPFDVTDKEGLGHETAFLYHVPTRVLVLQRNRSGVNDTVLARYVENMLSLGEPIGIDPMVRPDVMNEILGMGNVKRFVIKVAKIDRTVGFDGQNRTVNSAISFGQSIGSPSIEIVCSAGKEGHIAKSSMIAAIKGFLGMKADVGRVEKISVDGERGAPAPGKKRAPRTGLLNILDYCFWDQQPVKAERRVLPYHGRASALREAWKKHKQELGRVLKSPEAGK